MIGFSDRRKVMRVRFLQVAEEILRIGPMLQVIQKRKELPGKS